MRGVVLAATAELLRRVVRRSISDEVAPGPLRRGVVHARFAASFAPWMALRQGLKMTRRRVEVVAMTDFGHAVACPLPDMIPMYLYLFGVWEPDVTAYLRASLRPGDGFVDVGANHGAFVLLAAELVGPDGVVIGIEALPWMAERLRSNLERNGIPTEQGSPPGRFPPVRIVEAAVSDREGELDLYEGPFENLGRTTTLASRGERRAATVRSAPLPTLVDEETLRRARVIKIDVEGAEPAVLRGMTETIGLLRPDAELLVELSPHWWRADGADGRHAPTVANVLDPFLRAGFLPYELPNDYWPWRYAFPRRVRPPRRVRERLERIDRRIDLVLSRRDCAELRG